MNRADLVNLIAARTDLTKPEVNRAVMLFFDAIIQALDSGERVTIDNFGSFRLYWQKERQYIRPLTDEVYTVGPRRVPSFCSSPYFRKRVAEGRRAIRSRA